MKKTGKLLAVLLAAVMLVSVAVLFSSCGKERTATTAENFTNTLQNDGFTVQDVTAETQGSEITDNIIVAKNSDELQIEAYFFKNSSDAVASFNQNKSNAESDGSGTESSVSLGNYMRYKKTANDKVYLFSLIDNTMLYCVTDSANAEKAEQIFETLGYK